MAEINIQRKKKPVWPWIVLMLVLLAAAAIWYFNSSGQDIDNPINTTGHDPVSVPQMSSRHSACLAEREPALRA
jgi:hypothetical protein